MFYLKVDACILSITMFYLKVDACILYIPMFYLKVDACILSIPHVLLKSGRMYPLYPPCLTIIYVYVTIIIIFLVFCNILRAYVAYFCAWLWK
jgi:hypothetical protein